MKSFSLRKSVLAVAIGASMSSLAFAAGVAPIAAPITVGTTVHGGGAATTVGTGTENLRASDKILIDANDPSQGYYIVTELQYVEVTDGNDGEALFDDLTGNLTLASGEKESYRYMYAQRQAFEEDGTPTMSGGNQVIDYGYILTANGTSDFGDYVHIANAPLDPTDLGDALYTDVTNGITGNPDDATATHQVGGNLVARGAYIGQVNAPVAAVPEVPEVPESAPGAGDGTPAVPAVPAVPGSGAHLVVDPDNSVTQLGSVNAAGSINGITTSATQTVVSGGTGTTTLTLQDDTATQAGVQLSGTAGAPVRIGGVAAGVAATDAVNVGQLDAFQSNVNSRFSYMDGRIKDLKEDAFSGIASAIALSAVQMPSAPGKTAVSIGGGFYKSEQAVGLNVVHAVSAWGNNNGTIGLGIASGTSGGNTAGKISVGFEF